MEVDGFEEDLTERMWRIASGLLLTAVKKVSLGENQTQLPLSCVAKSDETAYVCARETKDWSMTICSLNVDWSF